MYSFMSDCKDFCWEKLQIEGIESKLLFEAPELGIRTVLTKIAPGAVIPQHHHSDVAETVFVIEGDFVEENKSFGPGSYFVAAAKVPHGPHTSSNGCIVLTQWTGGSFDFVVGV